MAISDPQKVDYLWKKIGYSAAKTQTKSATEESIPSPLQIRGDKVMTQSASIPATLALANTDTSGIVTTYPTAAPLEMPQTPVGSGLTARGYDTSAPANMTFTTGLTDWISAEFGSTYFVRIFTHTAGSASTAVANGTELAAAASGYEWFFDYQAGVLHFIGTSIPASVSGKSVYIVGARYTGAFGVTPTSITGGTF
jgi:hypothetical protein